MSSGISGNIWFIPTWRELRVPDPRADVAELRRQDRAVAETKRLISQDVDRIGCGDVYDRIEAINRDFRPRPAGGEANAPSSERPRTCSTRWRWYDARYLIASALGGGQPLWDATTDSWWMDRKSGHPLESMTDPAEIRSVPIPDWGDLPQTAEMIRSRERWIDAFPGDRPDYPNVSNLFARDGVSARFLAYPSFVDLGLFLLGTTEFLAELALESDRAEALMDLCFALSTSYVDFMHELDPKPFDLLLGFAGDTACLLSPPHYERYSVRWDARLFDHTAKRHALSPDFPCNLHSCGPSAHLYDSWGRHPHRHHITVLQTRLLPGTVRRLRSAMPETLLQVTFHPQHFDIAVEEPDRFRRALIEAAEHAELRDLHFTIIAVANRPEEMERLTGNLDVFSETLGLLEARA